MDRDIKDPKSTLIFEFTYFVLCNESKTSVFRAIFPAKVAFQIIINHANMGNICPTNIESQGSASIIIPSECLLGLSECRTQKSLGTRLGDIVRVCPYSFLLQVGTLAHLDSWSRLQMVYHPVMYEIRLHIINQMALVDLIALLV